MPAREPSRAVPAALLALALVAVLWPVLGGGQALLAVHTDQLEPWRAEVDAARLEELDARTRPLAADKTLMFQPQLEVAFARLARGETPLWNPDSLCGVPLLAQAVHGVMHPPNLLAWWLSPTRAWGWIALLQTLVAAGGAYALARALGGERWAAALTGLSFACCGFLAGRLNWYQIHGASVWLPLGLLAVLRLCDGARVGALLLLSAVLGCSLLAGFPQSSLLLIYSGAALAAWELLPGLLAGGGRRRAAVPRSLRVAGGLALGVALGLPQLLPSLELARSTESGRGSVPPEVAASLGMRPVSLLAAVVPDLFGHPDDLARHTLPHLRQAGALQRALQEPKANAVETASTIGLVPLLLALLGLATASRGRGLFAALFLGGALLAVRTPLLPLALHLPGLSAADPRRFLLLFELGGAVLAGIGLSHLLRQPPPRWFVTAACLLAAVALVAALLAANVDAAGWMDWIGPRLSAATGVSLDEVRGHADDVAFDLLLLQRALARAAIIALAGAGGVLLLRRWRAVGLALLLVAASADLLQWTSRAVTAMPADGHFRSLPGLQALKDPDGGRLERFTAGDPFDVLAYPLPPNTGLPAGVRDVSGYITFPPRRVERLHALLQPGTSFGVGTAALSDPAALDSPLLDLFAVSRVLSTVPLERPGLTSLGRVGDGWLYRNDDARPRAALASTLLVVPDEEAAAAALEHAGPEARARAVVEGAIGEWAPGATASFGEAPGRATLLRDEPEAVEVEVSAARDGVLVLADTWMPGWSAELDGRPAEMRPANLAFRAVAVPAGEHRVRFTYASAAWTTGSRVGAVALGAWLVLAAVTLSRRGRSSGAAATSTAPPARAAGSPP